MEWLKSVEQIQGWMSRGELTWLHDTARTHSRILEIGVFCGRSASAMLLGSESSVYFGIDNFSGASEWDEETRRRCYHPDPEMNLLRARNNITKALITNNLPHPEGRINLICSDISEAFPRWFEFFRDNPPSLIFIDGGHTEREVSHDIRIALSILAPGGTIAGHDFDPYHPGVQSAVIRLVDDYQLCGGPNNSIWYATPQGQS